MTTEIVTGLKVPFRQQSLAGCGSIALANLFNDKRYYEGVEDRKQGEGIFELNKKLEKFAADDGLFIDAIFCTSFGFTEQPNKLIDPLPFQIKWDFVEPGHKEGYANPILMTVKLVRFHCILVVHNLKNDRYYVVDGKKEFVEILTLEELMTAYHITTVEMFYSSHLEDVDNRSIFIDKNYLRHIIPEGE